MPLKYRFSEGYLQFCTISILGKTTNDVGNLMMTE